MVRASGILRRIVVPVEKNLHPTDGPRPRGAKAVIDESTAARLSAVVGDGEFSEFAGVTAHGAPEDSATTTAALIRRNTPAAAIAVATLVCLWVGNRMNQSLPDTVAHAGADGGSFGEPTAAAGPMFGAGRDPGARGGDPAMNLKNSARVAVLAVTAAVTANGALAGDAVQWRVADGGNGHWYRNTNVGRSISWGFAKDAAEHQSGFLVCLEERRESDWVWSNVVLTSPDEPSEYGGWIGLRQIGGPEPLGGWSWISGVPLSYFELAYFDNAYGFGAESYGCYYRTPPYTAGPWADNNFNGCWYQDCVHEYVTEWSADCNSDGIVDYGQCHDGTLPDYNGNNIPDCCEQGVQCTVGNYPVQWKVSDGGNGHWYKRHDVHAGWKTQMLVASALGARLVEIGSPELNAFLLDRLLDLQTVGTWIGLHQLEASCEPACGWGWGDFTPATWTNWFEYPAEPNDQNGNEDFGIIYVIGVGRGYWNDGHESDLRPAIIEWSADCNNDNIVDFGQILNGTLPDTNTNNIPDCCEPGNNCCLGDIYVNHIVDGGDLGVLLSEWGAVTPTTRSDLNRDGFVDGADLGRLLANWGPCGG